MRGSYVLPVVESKYSEQQLTIGERHVKFILAEETQAHVKFTEK